MELKHIDIARLSVSTVNMRGVKKAPDLTNILPSVRARGVLVPLIVRAVPCPEPVEGGSPDTYEIVAGKRRYHAALAVAEEGGGIEALPCAVIEAGDDAAALEASLIENIARLDPDEVTRWETFTRLVREGRSPEDIALTFGLTEVQVKRTLALGNLLPRIRNLYRDEKIDAATVQYLTLASRAQQRDWLAMLDDPKGQAPMGRQLKAWLFGGHSISTKMALFDPSSFQGSIVSDLFGDDGYFASPNQFWAAQDAAVAERVAGYREAGWADVLVLERGETFHSWEHERRTKKQGGKVFVSIGHGGDISFHEGYISRREARKLDQPEGAGKAVRSEITAAGNDYVDLHRHAAVRAKLVEAPGVALRVVVAHMIAGSPLWNVRIEEQRAGSDAVTESVESCASEAAFDAKRREMLALLDFDPEQPTIARGAPEGLTALYIRLGVLDAAQLLDVLAIVMGETLDARSVLVEALGLQLGVDMATLWQPDDALLDLVRDREVLLGMVEEVAGAVVAKANANEPGKTLKTILRDHLAGNGGRTKVENWVPRWFGFPAASYTERGGVGSATRCAGLNKLLIAGIPTDAPELAPEQVGEAPCDGGHEPVVEDDVEIAPEPVREAA